MDFTFQFVHPTACLWLRYRLGEEHMMSLLLNNSIFLFIENDFYVQLTGK